MTYLYRHQCRVSDLSLIGHWSVLNLRAQVRTNQRHSSSLCRITSSEWHFSSRTPEVKKPAVTNKRWRTASGLRLLYKISDETNFRNRCFRTECLTNRLRKSKSKSLQRLKCTKELTTNQKGARIFKFWEDWDRLWTTNLKNLSYVLTRCVIRAKLL